MLAEHVKTASNFTLNNGGETALLRETLVLMKPVERTDSIYECGRSTY